MQFTNFVEKLSAIVTDEQGLEDLDAKDLIQTFLSSSKTLYIGCEEIMFAIAASSMKHSCESVLETFISRYKNHFDQQRNFNTEDAANEEFAIAVKGSNLANCDNIVEAMDAYWQNKALKWHFFRTTELRKTSFKFTSYVCHSILQEPNSLPFMG